MVDDLRPYLKKGFAEPFRHVNEAVDSILLNIGEGSDATYPRKKIEFFDVAKNSANEAASGLRSLGKRKAFGERSTTKEVVLAHTIKKMLESLIKSL